MWVVDGFEMPRVDMVIGVDLSLTGPGIAAIPEPWGRPGEIVEAKATTLSRVPSDTVQRGLTLRRSADRVGQMATNLAARAPFVLVVMEGLLLQSGTGKAPERAAFWWMVRGELEARGYAVTSVHPTTRKSLGLDDEGREALRTMSAADRKKNAKRVGLQSMRRRWPGVVFPDDNASDALVCAELGARALGWGSLPEQNNKNLPNAIRALGIEERKAQ